MKTTKNTKNDEAKNVTPEEQSAIRIIKKKELQTEILKKIIKNNKLSDNKSF